MHSQYKRTDERDFETEKDRLLARLAQFKSQRGVSIVHPLFGTMTVGLSCGCCAKETWSDEKGCCCAVHHGLWCPGSVPNTSACSINLSAECTPTLVQFFSGRLRLMWVGISPSP